MNRLRNFEPATYNKNREKELPLPSLQNDDEPINLSATDSFDDHENEDDTPVDDSPNNEIVSNSNSAGIAVDVAGIIGDNELAIETPDNDGSNSVDSHINDIDPLAIDAFLVPKTESSSAVPLFNIHEGNRAEIEELLDEVEEIQCDDDVIMITRGSAMPKPWSTTVDELIKRENDKMTGNIAFNQTVSVSSCCYCPYCCLFSFIWINFRS